MTGATNRIFETFPITFRTEECDFAGTVEHLDKDGVVIAAERLLEAGTIVDLEFLQPRTTQIIRLSGRVQGPNGTPNTMVVHFRWQNVRQSEETQEY